MTGCGNPSNQPLDRTVPVLRVAVGAATFNKTRRAGRVFRPGTAGQL